MISSAEAAAELLRRRKARASLQSFIKYLNPETIESEFSRKVCAALEEFYHDLKNGLRPVLILQAPPQHGKSEIVSRNLPAWLFGQDPNLKIGGLSYGKDLATDMNRDVQRVMMSDEYKLLFPNSALNSKRAVNVDVEPKRNSETFEVVGHGGRYIAQGVGGPLTGKQLSIGIIDDPIKNAKEALSKTVKDSLWNWYITTFLTRLSKNSGHIVMATSWATDDLSGRIIETNKNARVLKFPAISADNRALVPELHPLDKLLETKATMSSYFWSAMYQQEPFVLGGDIIKGEWFKYYDVLPKIKYKNIFADTAQKTSERHDYSVFSCWGLGDDGKLYLLDMLRGKWEAPDLERRALAFWNKHSQDEFNVGPTRRMIVEDKASGTGLIQSLKSKYQIPVEGIGRTTDKYTRLLDVVGYIEAGYVYVPENAPFSSDFIAECEAFTADDSHEHDDQVDTMIDAINSMLAAQNKLTVWERLI